MSRFYPGLRIKKVRGGFNVDVTALVVELSDHGRVWVVLDAPCTSDLGWPFGAGDRARLANPADWEPIVPPGLESIEEINALYEPQGVTA